MLDVRTKKLDEITIEEALTLFTMGYELTCENGHVTGVSREVNA